MENKGQGIFYGVIGVATLVVAIIGATFAFFSASATNGADVINGTTGQGGQLTLQVSKVQPANMGKLIPMNNHVGDTAGKDTTYQTATAMANNCIDSNGNTVCAIYSITVTNTNADSAITVDGKMTLTSEATHMSWKLLTDATTDSGANQAVYTAGTEWTIATSLGLGTTAHAARTETYYVLVWLEETGAEQDNPDANKTFSGSVTFGAGDGQGLTATFTASPQQP